MRNECDCCAGVASSAGSSTAMHILLQVVGSVIIDNQDEIADIEASRSNAGSHKDAARAGFKVIDCAFAVRLQHTPAHASMAIYDRNNNPTEDVQASNLELEKEEA
jgi:hypothetical protein